MPSVVPEVSLVLADPHARLRAAIVALLAHEPDLRVLGSVGSGGEAAAAMRRHRPDVVVASLSLLSPSGRLLDGWGPVDAAVPIVVTGFETSKAVEGALLGRGATAYVAMERLADDLPGVLRRAARAVLLRR
ncbi:MAG TPA: hypothetical protein VFT50_18180 [Baekduia sp.]|nr:hypothetical protein [Baekduia sp.]